MAISLELLDEAIVDYMNGTSAREACHSRGFSVYPLYDRLKFLGISTRSRKGASGPDHYAWKGGKHAGTQGYIYRWVGIDNWLRPMAKQNGHVAEHRAVMAEHLSRLLRDDETVHHKNGDKADNRLENLQLRSGLHGKGQAARCAACGSCDIIFDEV